MIDNDEWIVRARTVIRRLDCRPIQAVYSTSSIINWPMLAEEKDDKSQGGRPYRPVLYASYLMTSLAFCVWVDLETTLWVVYNIRMKFFCRFHVPKIIKSVHFDQVIWKMKGAYI